jgi:hypothetical protein
MRLNISNPIRLLESTGGLMKRIIIGGIMAFVVGLVAPKIATAQGTTTFLSNLGQTSAGDNPAGSDSWLAAGFYTGNDVNGYVPNSIQLGMADASGNPAGFTSCYTHLSVVSTLFQEAALAL